MHEARAQAAAGQAGVLVDGLNLAYWCGSPPTLRLTLALMNGLIERGYRTTAYFDASARHRLPSADRAIYAALLAQTGYAIEVPSGRRADGEMLRQARRAGACLVSRDRFRDYRSRYRKLIDDPGRVLSGFVQQDTLHLPSLAVSVALAASVEAVWEALQARGSCVGPCFDGLGTNGAFHR